ncbi:hypothetical protein MMC15_005362 [Xylographa vitiligo]|nr:hypothetical protein [Xylographa vitiligo]
MTINELMQQWWMAYLTQWPKLPGFSEILDYKGLTISPPIMLSQLTSLTLSISSSSPLAFRALLGGTPVKKADVTLIGRNEVSTTAEWTCDGPSTLHGVLDHESPYLLLSKPWQALTGPNHLFNEDVLAKHAAYILAEAKDKAGGKPFAVTPSAAAA